MHSVYRQCMLKLRGHTRVITDVSYFGLFVLVIALVNMHYLMLNMRVHHKVR